MSSLTGTDDDGAALGALRRAFGSSIGSKVVMAATGVVLLGFLAGHLSGNLLVFSGPRAINEYAGFLHDHPGLVWAVRVLLLVSLGLHVYTSTRLALSNRDARPVAYAAKRHRAATFSGLNMIWTGVMVLAYLVYHVLHFTTGGVHTAHFKANLAKAAGRPDVYSMVVRSFSEPGIVVVYTVAMVLLGIHLSHAISSAFQTLGLTNTRYRPVLERFGPVAATLIVLGFLSVPLGVLAGWAPPRV